VVVPVLATMTLARNSAPTDPDGSSNPARTVTNEPVANWCRLPVVSV